MTVPLSESRRPVDPQNASRPRQRVGQIPDYSDKTSWPTVQFGELYAEPSRNGIYKSKDHYGTGSRIINMGELFAHDIINTQETKRVQMTAAETRTSGLADGDLLFGRRSLVESGAGRCSLVDGLTEPTTFESSIIRVRVDQSLIRPRFIFYWLRSHRGVGSLRAIVTGTNVKGIRGSTLRTIDMPCPSLRVQDAIVSILSLYDDLIENNRRRIGLLERAARSIYTEWFIRLRFPGSRPIRIVDGIPEGWKKKRLAEVCKDVREAVDPQSLSPGTAYIGLEHIPRRSITLNRWASAASVDSTKLMFRKGDILFGKIRPYFHKVGFALVDGIASSDAIVVRPTSHVLYEYVLLFLSSDRFVSLAAKTVREGSKMPRADWKFLLGTDILVPGIRHLISFKKMIEPVLHQLCCLALTNRQLSRTRDLLLPRLMNGEVAV